jgi:hypothetical protein
MTCPIPWFEIVWFGPQETIEETLLLQVNVTVVVVSFQPAGFGTGDNDAEIVGSACSRLTATEVVAELPATSVAVPETG